MMIITTMRIIINMIRAIVIIMLVTIMMMIICKMVMIITIMMIIISMIRACTISTRYQVSLHSRRSRHTSPRQRHALVYYFRFLLSTYFI